MHATKGFNHHASILLAPAAIIVPSKRIDLDIAKLIFLGSIAATFFLFTASYLTPSSWTFLAYADAIVQGTKLYFPDWPGVAARDIGFPLIILLSGYTFTRSIILLTLIHAAFATMIPVFVYASLSKFSKTVAFYAGCATLISLTPFLFMKWIHHDQTYIFFMMFMIALLLRYLQTLRIPYLYAFTAAAIGASLARPAGNLLLPIFLGVAYAYERKRLLHYATCAMIMVASAGLYQWHRHEIFVVPDGGPRPSYTGQQIFYGLYINSVEFGVTLSSELGPNIKRIASSTNRVAVPNSSRAFFLRGVGDEFVKLRIDPFSATELAQQVFLMPCYYYHQLMGNTETDDPVYLRASLEIARAYPLYVARYILRNFLIFIFRPGYAHPVPTCGPLSRVGLLYYPDYSRIFGNPRDPQDVYPEAIMLREIDFDPPRSKGAEAVYSAVRAFWTAGYDRFVDLTSVLMVVAWIIASATLLTKLLSSKTFHVFAAGSIGGSWLASVSASSALLFYNGLVTAAFAEPDYRYHHMVLPVRIVIAALGAVAVMRLCRLFVGSKESNTCTEARLSSSPIAVWVLLFVFIVGLFGSWTIYMLAKTHG